MMQQQLRPAAFHLCEERNMGEFDQIVSERLEQGWHLHGTPFFANGKYCQGMIQLGVFDVEMPDQPEPQRILSPVQ